MIVKYKLLGNYVNPVNSREISLEISHDQESIINQPKPHVGINNLYLAREDIQTIMNYIATSPGCLTEGLPFDIEIKERGVTETINMYLNLMEGFKRSNDGIEASVKMLQSLDWLDDRIDGFTFESMYNETPVAFTIDGIAYSSYQDFFDKRCIYIPYVLSTIPNRQDAFMTLFSMSYIIIQLSQGIKQFIQWCTPVAGVMPSVGIAQVVLEIVFFVFMLIALVALINHLFNCLVQPIKYHGAMLLIDLLKIVSHKLGLDFNSSIWNVAPYNQIAYLPEKFNPQIEVSPTGNSIFGISFAGFAKTGFTSPGYAPGAPHDSTDTTIQKGYMNGVGGDVFRLVKKFCNGKIIIPDQTNDLVLERRDYYPAGTPYQLPDIRQDWNGYNTDELTANILIRFAEDLNDKNCIDKYIGTILHATHSQIITTNQLLVMLKGLREIQIMAARGIRKDTTSFIEDIYTALIPAFNAIHNAGIAVINVAIIVMNALILVINILIVIFNILMNLIVAIVQIVAAIVNAINAIVSIVGGNGIGNNLINPPAWGPLLQKTIPFIAPMPYSPISSAYTSRVGALLLENDMVSTPKLLLVDTTRPEFIASGGYAGGQKRIAYLQPANQTVINAQWLWDYFYSIDAFVGSPNNRFTEISPALNKDSEKNPFILSLADFKNLVSNPKLKDNFAEEIIADTIQWRIGDESGRAEIEFRKAGWLKNPQSNNGAIRAQEVNINLQIKISLPNGQ